MTVPKSVSLLEVLQGGADFLKKNQVEQPRLHVEHLLAHVLGIPRLELYLQFDRLLSEKELAPLREYLRKRSKGIPLQHLLGTVDFFGRTFSCDLRALIPRPETEQLVERALSYKNREQILDVGTGSGVIAITLALENKKARVEAIDFSAEALALAQENAQRHDLTNIIWHQGDLLEPLSQKKSPPAFDLIVANLPYIPKEEIPTLSREISHDPVMALDGGSDGLDLIKRLIEEVPAYLKSEGYLLLEIGKNQEEEVIHILKKYDYHDIVALPDYQGVLRFVEAVRM
ncbi:MAG: peptide chain release factor N(5)-glutamine methyltransferase [Chthoniobacterales bacterium]|nr:peptide chain release factor N(5)-glutamine methyltransferase [Chthoniobacterales bacterium]